MTTLRNFVLTHLEGASEKAPISVEALTKAADKIEADPDELYALLDQLNVQRIVVRRAGMRAGRPALSYWLANAPAQIPARNNRPKPFTPTPAAPAATKEPAMKRNKPQTDLPGAMLAHITAHPGLTGSELIAWAERDFPATPRHQVKAATQQLRADGMITSTGQTAGMRYYAGGTPLNAQPAQPANKLMQELLPASTDREHATKAAQCADLLLQDMSALAKTKHPLIHELVVDLLPAMQQINNKLGRLAGHIHQLTQGAKP